MPESYQPKPIDTTRVAAPPEILALVELLAKNTHDLWASTRIAQGWKFGPHTSDLEKLHPSLVPYEQLPEEEKIYDRKTALETINVILALGFKVEAPESLPQSETKFTRNFHRLAERLLAGNALSLQDVNFLWESRPWHGYPSKDLMCVRLGQQTLEAGENFLAYDVASAGLHDLSPASPRTLYKRLVEIQALALARSGSPLAAIPLLEKLRAEGQMDEETLGILARTHKDLWLLADDSQQAKQQLEQTCELYLSALRLKPANSYVAINAASMCLVAGRRDQARRLAVQAQKDCLAELEQLAKADQSTYWQQATLAEAALLLGDFDRAETFYRNAAQEGRDRFADLASTRRQARFLLQHLCGEPTRFDACFNLPNVILFRGPPAGDFAQPFPHFNEATERSLRAGLVQILDALAAEIGFTAAASAGEIVLAELLLERGSAVHLVLPCRHAEFKEVALRQAGADWERRFDHVAAQAASLTVVSEHGLFNHPATFDNANQILHGLARIKCRTLETRLICLGLHHRSDGTSDALDAIEPLVRFWQRRGEEVKILLLKAAPALAEPRLREPQERPEDSPPVQDPASATFQIKALLYADVVGYTRLSEHDMPLFVSLFLKRIAELAESTAHKPLAQNTWGDALFFVFDDVAQAGAFALELAYLVRGTAWDQLGFSRDLNLRIALHAGPVHYFHDPIAGAAAYTGTHVSRAARIEPIAEEGQVYASQAFAALAASAGATDFVCDYVGQRQLAKGYGRFPVYLVRRCGAGL